MYSIFVFKQKTAYEMRISDWSSDVCSSDLRIHHIAQFGLRIRHRQLRDRVLITHRTIEYRAFAFDEAQAETHCIGNRQDVGEQDRGIEAVAIERLQGHFAAQFRIAAQRHEVAGLRPRRAIFKSEEHTSELQSLMRISYAAF